MNAKKETALLFKYPDLYPSMLFGFECEDGWFDLINTLSYFLSETIPEEETNEIYCEQVIEKNGSLRFWMNNCTMIQDRLIAYFSLVSSSICEKCGKEGIWIGYPYNKVRCNGCLAEDL